MPSNLPPTVFVYEPSGNAPSANLVCVSRQLDVALSSLSTSPEALPALLMSLAGRFDRLSGSAGVLVRGCTRPDESPRSPCK